MARDTRGPVPVGKSDLRRFSLNPSHWRQARRMLAIEALLVTALGFTGVIVVALRAHRGSGVRVWGLDVTPALSWTLVGIGIAAGAALLHRRIAMVFTTSVTVTALTLIVVSGAAAVHDDPGPLGFTAGVTLLYGVLFSYNLAVGIWLVPNHIEGPTWIHTARGPRRDDRASESHRDT
ncbi:hypothetical protein BH11ACT7_BH11ACT7_01310 [soil metagenome]